MTGGPTRPGAGLAVESAPGGRDFCRILAPNPGPMTLAGTNTYVVGREPAWVIDPGPDDAEHIEAVRGEGHARGGVAGVLLTHSHADHTAGVARLGAPVLRGEVSDGDELEWRTVAPHARAPGAKRDSSRTEVDGAPFEALSTPGHAADHACFIWRDVCFCGDLILGEGSTIVPPAAFGGSLGDYLASLRRVRELSAPLLAPGHGPWITDPVAKVDEYLTHRLDRERRLVAALESGERSRERLLDAAWADVPDALRPAAAMAMQAHLEKLEADGRGPVELTD